MKKINILAAACTISFLVLCFTSAIYYNHIIEKVMMFIVASTAFMFVLSFLNFFSLLYAKTIGKITLSKCPNIKPGKAQIVFKTLINGDNEVSEIITIKVYYFFFWWNIKYQVNNHGILEIHTREFESIEDAKEFWKHFMKPFIKQIAAGWYW